MLHDWYQKGYISKDAGTNTENWRTVCKAGNLFSLFFAYHPGTPVEFQSSTGYEFEIVPFYDQPIINSSSYSGIIYSIAQNSENPEKAMQVLDYIYGSPEVMNLLNWGEEGTDYVVEDEENGISSSHTNGMDLTRSSGTKCRSSTLPVSSRKHWDLSLITANMRIRYQP